MQKIKNWATRNLFYIIHYAACILLGAIVVCMLILFSEFKTLEADQHQLTESCNEIYNKTEEIYYCLNISEQRDAIKENDAFFPEVKDNLSKITYNTREANDDFIGNSKFAIGEEVPLPNLPTNIKFCTDYRFYNIAGTPHNRMQNVCYTDEYGIRKYNDDYCVGLGSFYSTQVGDRFEITLDTGEVFTVILADGKADCDTDISNMYTPCVNYDNEEAANVLEFIIDRYAVDDKMYEYGSLDYYDKFKGNITTMIYLGRDNSNDWDSYY